MHDVAHRRSGTFLAVPSGAAAGRVRRCIGQAALLFLSATVAAACATLAHEPRDTLFQVSTLPGLAAGDFTGEYSGAALAQHGDFGIGTFTGLDGELVLLDGQLYQINSAGRVATPPPSIGVPFALVTFFPSSFPSFRGGAPAPAGRASAGTLSATWHHLDFAALAAQLDAMLPTRNIFYAVRLDGEFAELTVRSVRAQHVPYPPLAQAARDQSVFHLTQQRGTLVGFFTPSYAQGFNLPGYHFHFISADRRTGGHVLHAVLTRGVVRLAPRRTLTVALPQGDTFAGLNLAPAATDWQAAER